MNYLNFLFVSFSLFSFSFLCQEISPSSAMFVSANTNDITLFSKSFYCQMLKVAYKGLPIIWSMSSSVDIKLWLSLGH